VEDEVVEILSVVRLVCVVPADLLQLTWGWRKWRRSKQWCSKSEVIETRPLFGNENFGFTTSCIFAIRLQWLIMHSFLYWKQSFPNLEFGETVWMKICDKSVFW